MKTYKRALKTMLMGIISAPFSAVVVVIVGGFFTENISLLIAIGIALCMVILCITIFGENISFTISPEGELAYYKRGKLIERYDIPNCQVGYYRKTTDATDHDISLRILPHGKDEMDTVYIDASPLGLRRFERMFAELERHTMSKPEVLSAKPKQSDQSEE